MRTSRILLVTLTLIVGFAGCGRIRRYHEGVRQRERQSMEGLAARIAYLTPPNSTTAIPKDFFTYDGFRDWFRCPLVYPYQLVAIDTQARARLEVYLPPEPGADSNKSSRGLSPSRSLSVDAIAIDRRFACFRLAATTAYALFRFEGPKPAEPELFATEAELFDAARTAGFVRPGRLVPVAEFIKSYFEIGRA